MSCFCGSVFIPSGTKYNKNGFGLRAIHENQTTELNLVHDSQFILNSGRHFVTTSSKRSFDHDIIGFEIYWGSGSNPNLTNNIQVSINDFINNKYIGFVNINQLNNSNKIFIPCSGININENKKFAVHVKSLCNIQDIPCCSNVEISIYPTAGTISVPCLQGTTTTTTSDPSVIIPPPVTPTSSVCFDSWPTKATTKATQASNTNGSIIWYYYNLTNFVKFEDSLSGVSYGYIFIQYTNVYIEVGQELNLYVPGNSGMNRRYKVRSKSLFNNGTLLLLECP